MKTEFFPKFLLKGTCFNRNLRVYAGELSGQAFSKRMGRNSEVGDVHKAGAENRRRYRRERRVVLFSPLRKRWLFL